MATNPRGFLDVAPQDRTYFTVEQRVGKGAWQQHYVALTPDELKAQGSRCMDCGIPFCHNGCPVHNNIPDWNNLIAKGTKEAWKAALFALHATNNFPEFTGNICPAPCQDACVLNIDSFPVSIKTIECAIVDRGWKEGWIKAEIPTRQTGKKVGIIGSGPAGMAAAQQLARAGHSVTLYEKQEKIGGLLRFGIPDFKMAKELIDRRMNQMEQEGVKFRTGVNVGVDYALDKFYNDHDAVLLAAGCEVPNDLKVDGRGLKGIDFAMTFLGQQNRRVAGLPLGAGENIWVEGQHVIIIGGGDTGSDCVGTAIRQGAASVTQLEIVDRPPNAKDIDKSLIWPEYIRNMYRTSSSQAEGEHLKNLTREYGVSTTAFEGKDGVVTRIHCQRVQGFKPIPGSEFVLPADRVFLAMGFGRPDSSLIAGFNLQYDPMNTVRPATIKYQTSDPKIFAVGDMPEGQSIVVRAIWSGREGAKAVHRHLMSPAA